MSKNDFALYKNLCGKVSLSGGETLEVYREGKWLTHAIFQHNVNCGFFFLLAKEDWLNGLWGYSGSKNCLLSLEEVATYLISGTGEVPLVLLRSPSSAQVMTKIPHFRFVPWLEICLCLLQGITRQCHPLSLLELHSASLQGCIWQLC